jgi:hypothetical protein
MKMKTGTNSAIHGNARLYGKTHTCQRISALSLPPDASILSSGDHCTTETQTRSTKLQPGCNQRQTQVRAAPRGRKLHACKQAA